MVDFTNLLKQIDEDKKKRQEQKEEPVKQYISPKMERIMDDRRKRREAYKDYADKIRQSEQARKDILLGLKSGKDKAELFGTAALCISLLVGDMGFYNQCMAADKNANNVMKKIV